MKKLTALLLAFAMICVMGLALFSASETPYLLGDVDGDGAVTALDATYAQRILARLQSGDEGMTTRGDVDGDGVLSALDIAFIMRHLAHMTIPYPINEIIVAPTEAPTQKPTAKPDPYELPPI